MALVRVYFLIFPGNSDDNERWSSGIIHSNRGSWISQGSVSGNIAHGFSILLSAVYKYTHILICFYRKRKRSKNILFINLLRRLSSWYSPVLWEILQTPLGRPPMYFIQNWGHMGLFCCGEKSQIDQLVYFAFSFDRNQMAIIHCLSVQKVQVILILGQKYREPFFGCDSISSV